MSTAVRRSARLNPAAEAQQTTTPKETTPAKTTRKRAAAASEANTTTEPPTKTKATAETTKATRSAKRKSTSDLASSEDSASKEPKKRQTKRKSVAEIRQTNDQEDETDSSSSQQRPDDQLSSQETPISSQESAVLSSQENPTAAGSSQEAVSQPSSQEKPRPPSPSPSAPKKTPKSTKSTPKAKRGKAAPTSAPEPVTATANNANNAAMEILAPSSEDESTVNDQTSNKVLFSNSEFLNLLTDDGVTKCLSEFDPSNVRSKAFSRVVSVVGGSHPGIFSLLVADTESFDLKKSMELANKLYVLILTSSTNNNSFIEGSRSFLTVVNRLLPEFLNPVNDAMLHQVVKLTKGLMSLWVTHTEVERDILSDLVYVYIKLLTIDTSLNDEELKKNVDSLLYFTNLNKRIIINALCTLTSVEVQQYSKIMKPLFSFALSYTPSVADTSMLIKWLSLSREATRCGWREASNAGITKLVSSQTPLAKDLKAVLKFVFKAPKQSNSQLLSSLITSSSKAFEQVVEAVNTVNKRKAEKAIGDYEPEEGEPTFFVDTAGQKSTSSQAVRSTTSESDEADIQEELYKLISSLRESKQDEEDEGHNSDSD